MRWPCYFSSWFATTVHTAVLPAVVAIVVGLIGADGWLGRRVGVPCDTWVGVVVPVHRPVLAYYGSTTRH